MCVCVCVSFMRDEKKVVLNRLIFSFSFSSSWLHSKMVKISSQLTRPPSLSTLDSLATQSSSFYRRDSRSSRSAGARCCFPCRHHLRIIVNWHQLRASQSERWLCNRKININLWCMWRAKTNTKLGAGRSSDANHKQKLQKLQTNFLFSFTFDTFFSGGGRNGWFFEFSMRQTQLWWEGEGWEKGEELERVGGIMCDVSGKMKF